MGKTMKKSTKILISIFPLIIIILIIAIILLVILKKEDNKKVKEENNIALEQPQEKTQDQEQNSNIEIENNTNNSGDTVIIEYDTNKENNNSEERKQKPDAAELTQEVYDMNTEIGILSIPKTGVNTKIFCRVEADKMEEMPCFLYTTGGLNKKGITLIVGHNRVNGTLFSDNKNLEKGDIFYFTDNNENNLKYTIYSKFITKSTDTSFLNKDVNSPTIALSCCTDNDDENRIIILGKAE